MGAAWLWAACPVARGNGLEQCTAWLPPPDRSQLNVFRPAQSWESNELCVCVKEKAIIGAIEWQIDMGRDYYSLGTALIMTLRNTDWLTKSELKVSGEPVKILNIYITLWNWRRRVKQTNRTIENIFRGGGRR